MDAQENKDLTPARPSQPSDDFPSNRSGRMMGGLVIVAVGAVLLARQVGVDLPPWLFSWGMLLIVIGVYVGARHSFRDYGWLIPVFIGTVFLADKFVDVHLMQYFWPLVVIFVGLVMILKPRGRNREQFWRRWEQQQGAGLQSSEDVLDCVTIFGGVKKNIISKDFKGGEAVTCFGGTELNLMQADMNGKIVLELVQVFGGTKLIVPPHWRIQSEELVSIFGGLNDKRPLPADTAVDSGKVLVLKGTCIFGGIDIKSF